MHHVQTVIRGLRFLSQITHLRQQFSYKHFHQADWAHFHRWFFPSLNSHFPTEIWSLLSIYLQALFCGSLKIGFIAADDISTTSNLDPNSNSSFAFQLSMSLQDSGSVKACLRSVPSTTISFPFHAMTYINFETFVIFTLCFPISPPPNFSKFFWPFLSPSFKWIAKQARPRKFSASFITYTLGFPCFHLMLGPWTIATNLQAVSQGTISQKLNLCVLPIVLHTISAPTIIFVF